MKSNLLNLDDVCDFIILKMTEGGGTLNNLQLQKLLYYVQAWHLALNKKPLFNGKFQAWVNGPVNREIYDRFKDTKSLYSIINCQDLRKAFNLENIPIKTQRFLNSALEAYGSLTSGQLEEMTHNEDPWIEARKGYAPADRCEVEIKEETMGNYYRKRIAK